MGASEIFAPVTVGISRITAHVKKVLPPFSEISAFVVKNKSNFLELAKKIGVLGASLWALSKIIRMLGSVALPIVRGGFKLAFGAAGVFGKVIWNLVTVGIPLLFNGFQLLFNGFWFMVSEFFPGLIKGFIAVGKGMHFVAFKAIPAFYNGIKNVGKGIRYLVMDAIPDLCRGLKNIYNGIKSVIVKMWQMASSAVTTLMSAFKRLGIIMITSVVKGLRAIGGAFTALTKASNRNVFILSILALAALGVLIYKNWDTVKKFFSEFWDGIKSKWDDFLTWCEGIWDDLAKQFSWVTKYAEPVKNVFKTIGEFIASAWEITWGFGKIIGEVFKNVAALIDKFVFGNSDRVIPAWESLKTFFSDFWDNPKKKWDEFVAKLQEWGILDKIKSVWSSLKQFFLDLWDSISPNFSEWLKPIEGFWNKTKNFFGFSAENEEGVKKQLPTLPKNYLLADGKREQNNTFEITINGTKTDDAQSLASKVVSEVSNYNKTFLFDGAAI